MSSEYPPAAPLRAREEELQRIAERVKSAYQRLDELRAERARESTYPTSRGTFADAVATLFGRLSRRRPAGRSAGLRKPEHPSQPPAVVRRVLP